ncbi:MAG: hypothetical protein ACSW8I_09570 [bacterium]
MCESDRAHLIATIDYPLLDSTIDLSTALTAEADYGFSYECSSPDRRSPMSNAYFSVN